jgi:hypothetical protein
MTHSSSQQATHSSALPTYTKLLRPIEDCSPGPENWFPFNVSAVSVDNLPTPKYAHRNTPSTAGAVDTTRVPYTQPNPPTHPIIGGRVPDSRFDDAVNVLRELSPENDSGRLSFSMLPLTLNVLHDRQHKHRPTRTHPGQPTDPQRSAPMPAHAHTHPPCSLAPFPTLYPCALVHSIPSTRTAKIPDP